MKVYKSSKVTILRPEILSVTLGLSWAIFVFIITLVAIASSQTGGLIRLFQVIYPWYRPDPLGLVLGPIWGFVNGFLLGFFIGYIYNWLVKGKVEKVQDLVFELEPDKPVNIIQQGAEENPYTIAIVANPEILNTEETNAVPDPIIEDKVLFTKVVARIMRSFVNNELLRLPEIFDRIRFVTIFDDVGPSPAGSGYENALCKEFKPYPETVIEPRVDQMKEFVRGRLRREGMAETVDVIFAITASETHTRSSALFTREESISGDPSRGDVKFILTTNTDSYEKYHVCNNDTPGVVALSAWDDRLKTPVHEFAHAMSSKENGAIVDEYLDEYEYNGERVVLPFVINKQHREQSNEEIPKLFARYKLFEYHERTNQVKEKYETEYCSDRERCDKRPRDEESDGWTSYVPARKDVSLSCIMDIAYFGYRFDDLIFDFMYDRLMAKLSRS